MGLFRRGGNVRDTDDAAPGVDDAAGAGREPGATMDEDAAAGDDAAADDAAGDDAAGDDAAVEDAAPDDAAPAVDGTADAATASEAAGRSPGTDPAAVPALRALPRRTTRPAPGGPWDVSEVQGLGRRVDLGAIWVPGVVGMELRMEVDKKTNQVTGVAITLAGSSLQVQAFAAPRTEGIWDEIRAEIAESVTKQGGAVDELAGPFGRELLARLPVRTPEGRTGHRPARFIGHDGPRWFLRGVLTGAAAIDARQAALLEALFAGIVVVRGTEARAPRDLLALQLPAGTRRAGAPAPPATAAPTGAAPTLDPLTRGPEITETR